MQFIKNNSFGIVLAVASLLCGILLLIPVFMLDNFSFVGACQTIGMIVFFVGVAAFLLLKTHAQAKQICQLVLLVTGVIALIFLAIGMGGLSKKEGDGAIGKAYAYFAGVESTVRNGEELIAQKQAELDLKTAELAIAKQDIINLGVLAADFNNIVAGFTSSELFEAVNPSTTMIKDIVAKEGMENNAVVIQLLGVKAQLVGGGFGQQTLTSTPYLIGGIIQASNQYIPKLEEAISQLQGVIDSNAGELALGKTQINDANAAAYTLQFVYIGLMFLMGVTPILLAVKKLTKKD